MCISTAVCCRSVEMLVVYPSRGSEIRILPIRTYADLEIRIGKKDETGYPVTLTLDGRLNIGGTDLLYVDDFIVNFADVELGIGNFFQLATGEVPFRDGDLAFHHRHTPPPNPREFHDCDERWSSIAMRLMAKLPADRYPDPEELVDAVNDMAQKNAPIAMPIAPPKRSPMRSRKARRHI